MVLLDQKLLVLEYQPLNLAEIMAANAAVVGEPDGIQPDFAFSIRATNVDMGRLVGFIRVKVKSKRTNPKDCRHPHYATIRRERRQVRR
jgi:hypothetical protein